MSLSDITIEIVYGLVVYRLVLFVLVLAILNFKIPRMHPIVGVLGVFQYFYYANPDSAITAWMTVGFFLPELTKLFDLFPVVKKTSKGK
jgi:hypothetical protein